MTAGYLCAIGIAVIFMLYMDGSIGVLMLAFLLLMPLLSLIATLLVRKRIHISLELDDTAAKHRQILAVVKLTKDTVMPLPFLRLTFRADAYFDRLNHGAEELPPRPVGIGTLQARREYVRWRRRRKTQLTPYDLPLCLSLGTAREAEYRIQLTPQFCGAGTVTLCDVKLSDFLAMFRFRLPLTASGTVLITPEIPEMKASSNLFRSVSSAVTAADEETDAAPLHSASSMPGYEHRDYIPGDSLKRINWKLSSKRRHLMVRQDEPVALARLSVVLDFRRDKRDIPMRDRLETEEQMIETALGFLMLCAQYGYPCKLYYPDQNAEWTDLVLDSPDQLAVEAISLLRGGFRDAEKLSTVPMLPPELMQESGTVLMYFTTDPDAGASLPETGGTLLYLIAPEQDAGLFAVPKNGSLWLVTPERTLIQAGGEG
ncbi:MAG: DUF58 domain-containing protein [Oscillospiraceae bacterium]|nr:DUF58 domain-containing protein [Oscillospiraceae bacterium]